MFIPKLDINFAWPAWFGDAVSKAYIVGQLMPSAIAGFTQERVRCLVGEGRMAHPVPAVFWVLHPLCVVIRIALHGLGLAKLVHLVHVVSYTMFMVMTLQKAGGFEYQERLQTIAELRSEAV